MVYSLLLFVNIRVILYKTYVILICGKYNTLTLQFKINIAIRVPLHIYPKQKYQHITAKSSPRGVLPETKDYLPRTITPLVPFRNSSFCFSLMNVGDTVYECGSGGNFLDWLPTSNLTKYVESAHRLIDWLQEHHIKTVCPGHFGSLTSERTESLLEGYIEARQAVPVKAVLEV